MLKTRTEKRKRKVIVTATFDIYCNCGFYNLLNLPKGNIKKPLFVFIKGENDVIDVIIPSLFCFASFILWKNTDIVFVSFFKYRFFQDPVIYQMYMFTSLLIPLMMSVFVSFVSCGTYSLKSTANNRFFEKLFKAIWFTHYFYQKTGDSRVIAS